MNNGNNNGPIVINQNIYGADVPVASSTAPLVLGIISIALTILFRGPFFVILTFILSLVCLSKAKKYRRSTTIPSGKVTAGRVLGIISLIISIIRLAVTVVVSIFSFIYILLYGVGALVLFSSTVLPFIPALLSELDLDELLEMAIPAVRVLANIASTVI